MSGPVAYSRGANTYDATPEQRVAGSWDEFMDAIDTDRGTAKGQQWIAGPCAVAPDDDHHRNGGTNGSFAKAIGRPHRCKRCVEPRRFIGLDVDDGLTPEAFAALVDHLQRYRGMVYTTASHKPEAPRCRVVLELDMPAPRAELIEATEAIRGRVGAALADYGPLPWDDACDKPEQPLYLPVTDSSVYRLEGEALVLAELLAERPVKAAKAPKAGNLASLPRATGATRYALAALDSAVRKVATMPEGNRNELINKEAFGLGGFVPSGQLDAATIEAALVRATEAAGWNEPERTRQKIIDGINAGSLAPRTDGLDGSGTPWGDAHDPNTHTANAQRIGYHFGDKLMFVEGIGWHLWGPPWRHDDLGALKIAQGLGRLIAQEGAGMAEWVAKAKDKAEREQREKVMNARFKWASYSESAANIEASMRMAQPHMSCRAEHLDADPMLLGLPSGVLELDTGVHREHRHGDLITKVAGADYNPKATAPTWERFIAEIMDGDAELIDFLQRVCGYCLSAKRGEHLLLVLWGGGANGKSTFLGALQYVMGDYASTAAPGLLIAKGSNEHPTGLADLQGRRLVIVSETGEAGKLNEEQVKALTGGDRISARRMRQDFYQFDPTHQLILQTNHRPRVTGNDEGIWRRLRLVPFTVTVPPERRDPTLPDKLQAEADGILAWAVEGWRKYQADGMPTPDKVKAATAEYRDASDQVGAFLGECTEPHDEASATAAGLYAAYKDWCQDNGERHRPQRDFGMRLTERGFERYRTGGGYKWRGLALLADPADHYRRASRGE